MRTKTKQFIQNLYHEIADEEKAEAYLEESLPLVGLVVMHFNSLEKSLDRLLCETISDRTDAPGLIVIQKLNYSAKVDLFKRFCDDFHIDGDSVIDGFEQLITLLGEVGRLRNLVVHADWESTDEDGYTFVRIRTSGRGMEQEYVQFSSESLEKLIDKIIVSGEKLDEYWERRYELLSQHIRIAGKNA